MHHTMPYAVRCEAPWGGLEPLHCTLQVLKTEDLPRWPGAAFDANAVLDNAHALLSFLHAHCTRPGGSYWV